MNHFDLCIPHEKVPQNRTESAVVLIPVLNLENCILQLNEDNCTFGSVFASNLLPLSLFHTPARPPRLIPIAHASTPTCPLFVLSLPASAPIPTTCRPHVFEPPSTLFADCPSPAVIGARRLRANKRVPALPPRLAPLSPRLAALSLVLPPLSLFLAALPLFRVEEHSPFSRRFPPVVN